MNVLRSLKKHKTQGNPKNKLESLSSYNSSFSEMVVSRVIQDIVEDVHNIIKIKAN